MTSAPSLCQLEEMIRDGGRKDRGRGEVERTQSALSFSTREENVCVCAGICVCVCARVCVLVLVCFNVRIRI